MYKLSSSKIFYLNKYQFTLLKLYILLTFSYQTLYILSLSPPNTPSSHPSPKTLALFPCHDYILRFHLFSHLAALSPTPHLPRQPVTTPTPPRLSPRTLTSRSPLSLPAPPYL